MVRSKTIRRESKRKKKLKKKFLNDSLFFHRISFLSNRSDVAENDSEDVEMVEMYDQNKKAVFGRNVGTKSEETDPLVDRTSGKRRSISQRSGRSQEYNLAPSPFATCTRRLNKFLYRFWLNLTILCR